ncbi:MAG: SDR family NAD(P)-dependent oxidoreductase [Lentihominibacter sp.]
MRRVENKVCVITGGAQGIGAGIANRLAEEGGKIVVADLNLDKATTIANEIKNNGGEAIAFQVNVTDRAQVHAMIQAAVDEYGRIDVMFNNAGFNKPLKFLDITEENFKAIMDVNAVGSLIGTQEAIKQFIKQDGAGKVINTASISSRNGDPDYGAYCASKAAALSIIQSAAKAVTSQYPNITINGFAPGVVATPLWEQLDKDLQSIGVTEKEGEALANIASNILKGRVAYPEDIAGTALFLASSDSDYMTGQVIMIDGGMILV